MDEGFIFYIILAVIALVSQILKKRKIAQPPSGGNTGEGSPRPQKKPFSFEDILKELQEVVEEKPVAESPGRTAPVWEEEKRELVPPRSRKPRQYESYEGVDVKSQEVLETDTEEISEKIKRYKRDDHYNLVSVTKHPILEVLESDDGPKNAIILSEIINRKYD